MLRAAVLALWALHMHCTTLALGLFGGSPAPADTHLASSCPPMKTHCRCGVPARHLMYQFAGHADLVMRWPLLPHGTLRKVFPQQLLPSGSSSSSSSALRVVSPSPADPPAQLRASPALGQQQDEQQEQQRAVVHNPDAGAGQGLPRAQTAAGSVAAAGPLQHAHPLLEGLPDFGRDLVRIALGQADPGRSTSPAQRPAGAAASQAAAGSKGGQRVLVGLAQISKL